MRQIIKLMLFTLLAFNSCNDRPKGIDNTKKGMLSSSYRLINTEERSFPLDQYTAPKPQYIQFQENESFASLTLLNHNNGKIYRYNYLSGQPGEVIDLKMLGIKKPEGVRAYYFSETDSLYLYEESRMQVHRINLKSQARDSISLIGDMDIYKSAWTMRFPQYQPNASSPFLESRGVMLLTGMYPWALPDSIAKKFAISTKIPKVNGLATFVNFYPREHYSSHYEWDDPIYNSSCTELSDDSSKLVISFPVSHDLYLSDVETGSIKKVYAGSNLASQIIPLGRRAHNDTKYREKLNNNVVDNDLYSTIKYDRYRKVYYRFIRRSLKESHITKDWKSKTFAVIILDANFKYLGETDIGTLRDFNPENSFVSSSGLNIEYIDNRTYDESWLRFKIFVLQKV